MQRTGDASAASASASASSIPSRPETSRAFAEPMEVTQEPIRTSSASRSRRAAAARPTRIAVSRALARSRELRRSRWPNFIAPVRSAWPGRGSETSLPGSCTGSTAIRSDQAFA